MPAAFKKAVVVGGTGAIGEHVVGQLLVSGTWEQVVTVGRREVTVPPVYKPEDFKAKLEQKTVNMDNLATEAAPAFQGADSVFCCLGTTRAVAGSADGFRKVDLDYVKATAEAAKTGGASHFSLVTAVGSNPNVWACDWKIFHGLLYMKVKGLAEEAVKGTGFPSVSIFRPGLLDRGDKMRPLERSWANMMSSIPVEGVAKLMLLDAQKSPRTGVSVFEMKDLLAALKAGTAPSVGAK